MARIKKYAENLTQNLTSFQTFIVDTNPNSQYFRITEFNDTFTGGKNGFLIEGSEHLMESTEIKLQILDVAGDSVYYEPGNGIPEYYEGISKLVSVHIYEDTPIGLGKITVLGELKTYVDENGVTRDIPDNWKGVYNVKWERTFQINKNLSNEDKVRFYRRPEVSITEIVKPIFSNIVTSVTQTGVASGIPQIPELGQSLSGFSLPTSYLVRTNGSSFWTGSMAGSTITFSGLGFSSVIDDVVNATDTTITTPYTLGGFVTDFINEPYSITFNHLEGLDNLKTALTGSFAKIAITDLTTFVGDVARVKVFRKSQSDLADYQFIQEVQLESNEVLTDLESTRKNLEYYGIFEETTYNEYWVSSSNNLSVEFNTDFLYSSLKLDSSGVNNLFTSKSIDVQSGVEYTLAFNTRLAQNISSENYLSVFISGSRQSTINGSPITVQVEQPIVTITSDNSILQKSQLSANFQSEQIDNARLYFKVKGDGWYISDVSLRASQETSFSPDEITFIQPIPRTLPAETFDFLFQFYDINNNYIPVVVEESKTFDGGNLNVINKSIELIPSSLYFQFDSGSNGGNPVPPTTIFIDVVKNYLTGSTTFTSRSFDFFNNELSSSQYIGGVFPGLLEDRNLDTVRLTVENFTGSVAPGNDDIIVQFIEYTAECEGVEDSIIITRVQDGKGGVNYEIRPYNGIVIRNSDPSSSLEVQAIRIDGVNEINLRSGLPSGRSDVKLHVQSGSTYITLTEADSTGYVRGLSAGTTGSGELDYNAVFNRDSIDGQRTLYLIPSSSTNLSASILTSIVLTDLQDGLDAGVVLFDAETFTINPRTQTQFTPTFTSATASFYRRGTFEAPISCSFEIYPSMSINQDWVPEYFMYFVTHSCNPDISVVVYDEVGNIIPSRRVGDYIYSSTEQTKQLLTSFTYTEPWTTASVNVDKLFTIVPEGKPGDESIVFEVVPSSITLTANPRGIVGDYTPSITDIRLKQGSRYLAFSSSAASDPFYSHGQFYIATESISFQNITPGNVHFTSSAGVEYTSSLIVSASSNMTNLSGSVTYPLVIHPYYTSSIYTASVVVNYTKVLDGPPPIEFIVNDFAVTLQADEVQYISDYTNANTQIQVKEGGDYLTYTTQSTAPGTWRINSINPTNIQVKQISSSSYDTATIEFERFDYPHLSASAQYSFTVYPFSLGPGHEYTSSVYDRTQTFVKNVAAPAARSVTLTSTSETVNFDGDGLVVSPAGDIRLEAEVFNFTGSVWYQFLRDGIAYSPIQSENFFEISSGDSTAPGEIATWQVNVRDGSDTSGTPTASHPTKASAQVTISGIKAGAEVYNVLLTNENASLVGDVWSLDTTGSNTQIVATKSTTQLTHVTSFSPKTQDFLGNDIGSLGEYQVTILSKPAWITLPGGLVSGSIVPSVGGVATIGDVVAWSEWGNNTNAEIVYQIDIENGRQKLFKTQSLSITFNPDGPYSGILGNENSSVVYKVSGQLTTDGTGNVIRAFRGENELTHSISFSSPQTDAFGQTGYKDQYQVSVYAHSSHLDLSGSLTAGSILTTNNNISIIGNIDGWSQPEVFPTGLVIYKIELEGREFLYKTQSLAVQFEGNTGPGIVMRGVWQNDIDYIGSVETTNNRRDAVIWPDPATYNNETHFWAAVSGSGPGGVGPQQPDDPISPTFSDTSYWQYLGQEEFFVAAKIAIFEESYVKNTINVGTKDGTGAFANIVLAGGRPDPYIALGQTGTVGTAGTSGTSSPPIGVIGYDRPGIFLGIYEDGTNGTTGRFSIKSSGGASTTGLLWDGDTLTIIGAINQVEPGVPAGSFRGAWAPGTQYYTNDVVTYGTVPGVSSYIAGTNHTSTNDTNINTGYPPNATNAWTLYAASGTSGTAGSGGVSGTNGGPGAGVVYRGVYNAAETYYYTSTRRDVVKGTSGTYFLANNPADNGSTNWDNPETGTDWTNFGATFSSVATGLLLAENATITKGLVIGESGTDSGFIRSANANTIIDGAGFYISAGGQVRFGDDVNGVGSKYVYWDGTDLTIKGTVNIEQGSVGNWVVDDIVDGGSLHDSNNRIFLNPTLPEIQLYNTSAQKKVIISPKDNLTSLFGSDIYVSGISGATPSVPSTSANIVNGYGVFSEYVSGSATSFTVSDAGTYQVDDLTVIPTLAATTTGLTSVSATTAYPSYTPPYPGYSHGGYSSPCRYNIYLYVEISDAANGGNILKREQISYGTAQGQAVQPTSYYWDGSSWYSYSGYTSPASAYNPTPSAASFEVAFATSGTYYIRYSARVYVQPGTSYNMQTDGSIVYAYTQTTKSYPSITAIDSSVTLTYPLNFSELSGGGLQVVTDSGQYVQIPRETAGTTNPMLMNIQNGYLNINHSDVMQSTLRNGASGYNFGYFKIGSGWNNGINASEDWRGLEAHSFALTEVTYASPGTSASPNTLQYELSANGSALFFDPTSTSKYIELPYRNNSINYNDADKFQSGQIITIINEDDAETLLIKGLFHGGLANNFSLPGGACLTLMYSTNIPSNFAANDQWGWFIIGYYDNTG